MISAEVIEKYKQAKVLERELDAAGIFSIFNGAHMQPEDFLKHFKTFKVREHTYTNPFRLEAEQDGVNFFCLISDSEAVKMRGKIKKMQKLEKEALADEDKPND